MAGFGNGLKGAGRYLAGAFVASCLLSGTASASTIGNLSFLGATFTTGATMSGSFSYTYDASNDVTGVISADITITTVAGNPGFHFTLNTSVPDTVTGTDVAINDPVDGIYAVHFASPGGDLYPEFSGVGTLAQLIVTSPLVGGATTYNGNTLTSVGEGIGTIVAAVPEPASLALLGAGLFAGTIVRRRKRG